MLRRKPPQQKKSRVEAIDPPPVPPPDTVIILDADRQFVAEVELKGPRSHYISVQLAGQPEPRSYDHVGFDEGGTGKWCYAPSDRRTG